MFLHLNADGSLPLNLWVIDTISTEMGLVKHVLMYLLMLFMVSWRSQQLSVPCGQTMVLKLK